MMIIDKDIDVLVIVGPTAVGKSELGIELAQKYNGEIISGDAYQVYKKMDIGTAKVTKEEMNIIPHYLIDILDYDQKFDVAQFQLLAREKISEIKNRGKLPIIVGGTGLYIQAVLYDYKFEENHQLEEKVNENEEKNIEELQKYLNDHQIKLNNSELNNKKRLNVIVAKHMLNISLAREGLNKYYQNFQIIGLTDQRENLYKKINQRVDLMIENNLVTEVQQFDSNYYSQLAIGYKEIHKYLQQEVTLEEAIEEIKKNSRNFAKRQYTWFNNKMEITWYQKDLDNTWVKYFEE